MDSHLGVCIYYVLFHYVIYCRAQGKYYSLGNFLDFNDALERCQKNGSHLPYVDLENSNLLLKDFVTEGTCFWVHATLFIDTDHLGKEFPYPKFRCGTLRKDGETLTHSCIACSSKASYICMSDVNGYTSGSKMNFSTWADARDDCNAKGGLPLANNTDLQSKLMNWTIETRPYWIAKIGLIRPYYVMGEEHECGYWCKNEVTFGSCVQEGRNLTTYCVSALNVNTTAANVPTRRTSERAIWPIVGGAVGAFVVFIAVVIIIIIFVRRRRMKKGQDAVLNSSTNNTSPDNVPSQNNVSYDTVIEESIAMKAPIAKESVIYAQSQTVSKQSRNVMEGKFNIGQATDDQEKRGLYSKVQKEHNAHGISSKLFESGNGESSENVYNKANFHQEETANMYDKADFRLKVLEIGNINDYDKATFHRMENSNYDTGYITNATVDSTYDRLN